MNRFPFLLAALLICGFQQLTAQTSLPEQHPKFQTAQKVYKNLIPFIYIDKNKDLPRLEVVKNNYVPNPACYDPTSNIISIEEKAIEVCLSLGKDSLAALAALIGHETMHYYKNHGAGNYSCAFWGGGSILADREKQESEADLWGLFIAYLAGYEIVEPAPKMMASLYKSYALPFEINGYPSLPERQQFAGKAIEKLKDLTALFEAGTWLTALGEYEKSAACYKAVLSEFQSREMYNNLGVAQVLYVISLLDNVPYYPLEPDLNSRLYRKEPPAGFTPAGIKDFWLREAEMAFKAANAIDPTYVTATINLGCVYDLQGRYAEAQTAIAALVRKEHADAKILEGIIKMHQGDKEYARFIFNHTAHPFAKNNLDFLDGKSYARKAVSTNAPLDRICGEDVLNGQKNAKAVSIGEGITPGINYEFSYKNTGCSTSFSMGRKGTPDRLVLTKTRQRNQQTRKNAGSGQSKSEVMEAYNGAACTETLANDGGFLAFREKGLIFLLDKKGRVKEWAVFKIF